MPSLFRFLFILAVLAGIAYAAMFAVVMYVEPREREVSVRVPRGTLELERVAQPQSVPSDEQSEPSDDGDGVRQE